MIKLEMSKEELKQQFDDTYEKVKESEGYKIKYNDKNLWFDKFYFKILTLDGMYYTVESWDKNEIVLLWIYMEGKNNGEQSVSLEEVLDEMRKRGCEYIIGRQDLIGVGEVERSLLYLKEENKIINKNQIKETLLQFI